MEEAFNVIEEKYENDWGQILIRANQSMPVPEYPSAFPFGKKDLCESRIDILCGPTSTTVSG